MMCILPQVNKQKKHGPYKKSVGFLIPRPYLTHNYFQIQNAVKVVVLKFSCRLLNMHCKVTY